MENLKVNSPKKDVKENLIQNPPLHQQGIKSFTPPPSGIQPVTGPLKPNIIQRMQALPENERPAYFQPNIIQRMQALPEEQRPEILQPNIIQRIQKSVKAKEENSIYKEMLDQKQKLDNNKHDGIQYEFDGPFAKNDSVHEHITLKSLQKAGLAKADASYNSSSVWEYMRGVIWNDDPEGLLFDQNYLTNMDWSSGKKWYSKFLDGKEKGEKGEKIDKTNSSLTERSHFGDLQFIHGMASNDGELPTVTKEKIMIWAEFTYKVAIGEIGKATKLLDIPIPEIVKLFKDASFTDYHLFGYEKQLNNSTLEDLFHVHYSGNIQQRAIGSLLHLIQDSYAKGHVEREFIGENKYGAIKSFHSYSKQDEDKHGEADAWKGSEFENIDKRLSQVQGAPDAIEVGSEILKLYNKKENWSKVSEYLSTCVFILSPDSTVSGPGDEFKK